ncbi:GntP family permease, partial [bacterium]|nr:GntP family permease [bacterium]
ILSGPFLNGFSKIIKLFFLIFLFSCIFGKLLDDSGAALAISTKLISLFKLEKNANNSKLFALWILGIITILLCYGGVNFFVIMFVLMPLARPIFKQFQIPWHLIIIPLMVGAVGSTLLPGNPQTLNIIAIKYLGTTPTIAPWLPFAALIPWLILIHFYAKWQISLVEKRKENYDKSAGAIKVDNVDGLKNSNQTQQLPNFWLAIVPPIVLLLLFNLFKFPITWALICGCIVALVIFYKYINNIRETIEKGAYQALNPIVCWASIVGFGTAVSTLPGFSLVKTAIFAMPGGPMFQYIIAIQIIAAVTGSATGGWTIVLETLGNNFLQMGLNPAWLHWTGIIAAQGFDTLPHNGVLFGMFSALGLTHKDCYRHVFFTTVVLTIIVLIPMIIIGKVVYGL